MRNPLEVQLQLKVHKSLLRCVAIREPEILSLSSDVKTQTILSQNEKVMSMETSELVTLVNVEKKL